MILLYYIKVEIFSKTKKCVFIFLLYFQSDALMSPFLDNEIGNSKESYF